LGIDIAAPRGSDIFASHDGRILYAGRAFKGYGKLVIVESFDGKWATFYSHCQKFFVKRGQKVNQGKVIATIGKPVAPPVIMCISRCEKIRTP